jgi:HEAT repeat protein
MARLLVGDTTARTALEAVVAGKSMDAELRLRAAVALAHAKLVPAAALRATLRAVVAGGAVRPGPYRAALTELVCLGDTETVKRLTAALKSDNPNLRGEAAEVLARGDRADGKDALLTLAAAGGGELAPALALAEAGDGRAAPLLLPRLRDGAPSVRQRVLAALGQLAQRGVACCQAELAELLTDKDPHVATTAAVAWLSATACTAASTARPAGDPATSPHDRAR